MKSLFQPMLLPIVLEQHHESEQVSYRLEFSPELECFKGHFPGKPIFPGVGQIGFIQHFARQSWAELEWCNGFEQLKFQDLIQPYMVLQLKLTRKLPCRITNKPFKLLSVKSMMPWQPVKTLVTV